MIKYTIGLDVRRNIKVPINFQCPIHELLMVWWNQIIVGPSPRPSRRCVSVLYYVGGIFNFWLMVLYCLSISAFMVLR
jgi:hypothetical protein